MKNFFVGRRKKFSKWQMQSKDSQPSLHANCFSVHNFNTFFEAFLHFKKQAKDTKNGQSKR